MFHYDRGLFLTAAGVAVDVRRRQPVGFVSHAHSDHTAPHELALCTPATARLYQLRLGPRKVREMPYRRTLDWSGTRLTAYPAGHILGSAMLLAETDAGRLLYTGDFKLGDSATAEKAEVPATDILVMESTYGHPRYRLPPRTEVLEDFFGIVRDALSRHVTPVVHAYTLGKAQEVTRLLTLRGIPVVQHPLVYAVSRVYEQCGCDLGNFSEWQGVPQPGSVVVAPPLAQRAARLEGLLRQTTIALTGWATDGWAQRRLRVDHALPLSDHADYDELLEMVRRASPRVVYCTHGPAEFVERLRDEGWDARPLDGKYQARLF